MQLPTIFTSEDEIAKFVHEIEVEGVELTEQWELLEASVNFYAGQQVQLYKKMDKFKDKSLPQDHPLVVQTQVFLQRGYREEIEINSWRFKYNEYLMNKAKGLKMIFDFRRQNKVDVTKQS
jgi:hypothetical protein